MPLELVTVRHGRPAAQALHRAVGAAKDGDPLRPVTVVVPSNTVGVAARRQLASGGLGPVVAGRPGLAAVTFLTAYRLAELLAAPRLAGAGRRPVSTPVLAAAIRRALSADPGVFAPVAGHPATEEALVAAHRELRDLSPAARDRLAATSPRAADVVRIHRAATVALAPDWYDEHDLFEAALGPVADGAAAELGAVVVHLPEVLSRAAGRLLRALADAVPLTVVAARTGHRAADADVVRTLTRLGAAPEVIDRSPLAVEPVPLTATHLVSVSDADEEARAAVRAVVDAARAGTPLERCAILSPTDQPYARLVHEHLAAAELVHNGPSVRPLRERVTGRTLLALLALGDVDVRRDALFDLLSSLPASPRRPPVAAWETLSREAGVVAGADQWATRLHRVEVAARAGGDEHRAELAAGLRRFVAALVADLDPGPTASWRERCDTLAALVHRLVGGPGDRADWPLDEQRAADRVDAVLQRLATLDTVEPAPTAAAVRHTIELELDADLGRDGRLGDGVVTGPLATALGIDVDLVVVVGLAEGTLPGHRHDDALLPDRERAATDGELRLRSGHAGAQLRHLVAALAAGATTVLVTPRGDLRRSAERVVSRWAREAGAEEVVPSHAATLTRRGRPATAQEVRVRALAHAAHGGDPGAGHPLLDSDDVLRRGAELLRARASATFTRFDGNLGPHLPRLGLPTPSDPEVSISPTALETWVRCPFHYLVRQVLRIREVENPEERVVMSPLDYGTLVHAILEDHVVSGSANDPDPEAAAAALLAHAERRCREAEDQGLTGHPLYWSRQVHRLRADLVLHAHLDHARLSGLGATATAAEVRFGRGADVPPAALRLDDGRTIHLTGSIDRIDVTADGRLHVIDHKTGRSDRYRAEVTADDPVAGGTRLQLPVYGLAARQMMGDPAAPVRVAYSFPTSTGGFTEVGIDLDDGVLARFRAVVTEIVDGIEGGVFVARPEPGTRPWVACSSCDPDGLGTGDRRQEWERKRHDATLHRYAALVEPGAPEPTAVPAEVG